MCRTLSNCNDSSSAKLTTKVDRSKEIASCSNIVRTSCDIYAKVACALKNFYVKGGWTLAVELSNAMLKIVSLADDKAGDFRGVVFLTLFNPSISTFYYFMIRCIPIQ